jgi:hypothetical protein
VATKAEVRTRVVTPTHLVVTNHLMVGTKDRLKVKG